MSCWWFWIISWKIFVISRIDNTTITTFVCSEQFIFDFKMQPSSYASLPLVAKMFRDANIFLGALFLHTLILLEAIIFGHSSLIHLGAQIFEAFLLDTDPWGTGHHIFGFQYVLCWVLQELIGKLQEWTSFHRYLYPVHYFWNFLPLYIKIIPTGNTKRCECLSEY